MNAQRLKNAILQEAIEGRLVPQDPNDEPASALLARIRKEKEQLVKEGKLKKKDLEVKPISEDEIPFEIPESWEWVRLVDIGIAETGTTPSKSHPEYFGTFIPFLGPANMLDGKIISETQGLSKIGANYGRVVPKGTILQVCIGGSIGKCAIVDKPVTFNQQINSITPLVCVIEFIYYVLQSDYFRLAIKDKSTGTATPIINRGNWEQLVIPLPPLAEQYRIVSKIEELLPKVEEYGKAQDALNKLNEELPERLKKSILQEAIEGRLVPQDPNDEPASVLLAKIRKEKEQLVKEGKLKKKDLIQTPISEEEIPFEIPDSWEWVRWGELGEYKKGPFGSSLTKSMFVPQSDKAVKVYEQKNAIQKDYSLGDYYITKEKYETMTGFTVRPGDIIVSCAGTIGETYLLPSEAPIGIINQALMRAKLHLDSIIPYWLLHFQYILLIENKLKGSGSAIKNIPPFEVLKAMPVPLPPLAEQHRIVEKLEQLLGEIDKLKM